MNTAVLTAFLWAIFGCQGATKGIAVSPVPNPSPTSTVVGETGRGTVTMSGVDNTDDSVEDSVEDSVDDSPSDSPTVRNDWRKDDPADKQAPRSAQRKPSPRASQKLDSAKEKDSGKKTADPDAADRQVDQALQGIQRTLTACFVGTRKGAVTVTLIFKLHRTGYVMSPRAIGVAGPTATCLTNALSRMRVGGPQRDTRLVHRTLKFTVR